MICRALSGGQFISEGIGRLSDTETVVKDARKYGVMTPRNGEYFTYKAINRDREITDKTIKIGMMLAFFCASVKLKTRYVPVSANEPSDFTLEFVSTEEDELMTKNTLMYHFYPINNLDDPNRGMCRANSDYFWNGNGHGVDMHLIDPVHYPEPNPKNPLGKTYDFDKVYRHEAIGHGHGLPHINAPNHMMSPNEGIMSEYPSSLDWVILFDKYEPRNSLVSLWNNIFSKYKIWSEKY